MKKKKKKKFKLKQVYFGNWSSAQDVFDGFGVAFQKNIQFIFASYEYEDYSGYAFAVFLKDGKLYEINESHCSCAGLENWEPEETSLEALMFRPGVPPEAKDNLKQVYKKLMCFL
jgi:hypothetical protein